jgi:DNA-binding PadR family transcriptional regulator
MDKELMKGSIDILLLSQMAGKDMYGFEIVKSLQTKSNNLYKMSEGTLYPALQRLEQKKYLKSYWGGSETGGRRKYYSITDEGKKHFVKKIDEWNQMSDLINFCKEEGAGWINSENILTQS